MNPILRNILAVIVGLLVGSFVNMGLILISGYIIPPPADVDTSTMEGLKATMHLFQPKHFLFPFLAHALGTLVGALIAAKFAANHNMKFALAIGLLFFIGGLANVFMLPSPMWFTLVDLTGAYFPMAYLAGRLGRKSN
jgi:hypothetical protein